VTRKTKDLNDSESSGTSAHPLPCASAYAVGGSLTDLTTNRLMQIAKIQRLTRDHVALTQREDVLFSSVKPPPNNFSLIALDHHGGAFRGNRQMS